MLGFDMADINSFAVAAPAIRKDWGLSIDDIAIITSASFFGMFAGSLIGGRLADRFGRKRIVVWSTLTYSVASLATAFSVSLIDLTILRVLTGLGLMGATTALLTYVSEMFPHHLRGRVQAFITAISLLGIPGMAFFARWVVPMGESTWRWIFILGAGGIIAAAVFQLVVPESVRWLAAKGNHAKAAAIVERMESKTLDCDLRPAAPAPVTAVAPPEPGAETSRTGSGISRLLRDPSLRTRTIVLSIGLMFSTLTYYGFNAWVPTLLVERGMSAAESLTYVSILSLAACPGALVAMLFIDRWQRRSVILGVYVSVGALMLIFGFSSTPWVLMTSGILMMLIIQVGTASFYAYMPEVFPTGVRSSGVGVANSSGRIATFAGTFLIASIFNNLGYSAVFIFLCACSVTVGLLLGLRGEKTSNRSLEEISGRL